MATPMAPARSAPPPAARAATSRRYELDWMRALVVLGLIPIHAAVIFSSASDLFIKNAETNQLMALVGVFGGVWGMPLLFLVAGASAYFALNRRTGGQYLKERVLRLIVPFAFASLLIIPVQVYAIVASDPTLARAFDLPINNPAFTASYWAFYVEYLRGYVYFLTHFSPELAVIFWGHLWFIPRLFAYALVTLPLFFWLKSRSGQRLLTALGRLMRYPGAIYLLALPLVIVEMLTRATHINALTAGWPLYDDWVQFTFFLLFYIYGYLVYAISTMPAAIMRYGWASLALGLAGFALALTRSDTLTTSPFNYSLGYIAGVPIRDFVSWFWVVAVLSFAFHVFTFSNGLLRYLKEAAFPIYVLHLPILTVVGVAVVRLDLPLLAKFLLIIVVALGLTLALFELVVRRFRATRVLFGLKSRPAEPDPGLSMPSWLDRWALHPSPASGGGDRYAQ
jgi:peptidoglycan/LPS O-acetylase OafA/YrhL